MKTIDKILEKVIEKEITKLPNSETDILIIVKKLEALSGSINPGYTIPPKDTIGKNIYFNTNHR